MIRLVNLILPHHKMIEPLVQTSISVQNTSYQIKRKKLFNSSGYNIKTTMAKTEKQNKKKNL